MKMTLLCSPFVALATFLVTGICVGPGRAVAQPATHVLSQKKEADDGDKKDSTKAPFKGMTKAQARKAYGEPDSIGQRGGEELWTYVLNRGTSIAKSFIPFGVNSKLRFRLLTFKDGKVVRFRWDAPDKED